MFEYKKTWTLILWFHSPSPIVFLLNMNFSLTNKWNTNIRPHTNYTIEIKEWSSFSLEHSPSPSPSPFGFRTVELTNIYLFTKAFLPIYNFFYSSLSLLTFYLREQYKILVQFPYMIEIFVKNINYILIIWMFPWTLQRKSVSTFFKSKPFWSHNSILVIF